MQPTCRLHMESVATLIWNTHLSRIKSFVDQIILKAINKLVCVYQEINKHFRLYF